MRRLLFVLLVLASPFLWNCSENDKAPVLDQSDPEVRIFYPYDAEPNTFVVSDSVDTYFAAHDVGANGADGAPAKVELWFSLPGNSDRMFIGSVTQAISLDQVPAEVRPYVNVPAGWSLYTRRWYTGPVPRPPIGTPINSGTFVQLFAVAYDAAGNIGRSAQVVRIKVYNLGDDLHPPYPVFTISPPSGTTATTFRFDASATVDSIDAVSQIRVRWDFDGNPSNGWDIDWNRDARANEPQSWVYTLARSYRVIMEAHNSYLPDSIATFRRDVVVAPLGGVPRPPEPDNYVVVPAGTYVFGDSSYVWEGRNYPCDSNEQPVHQVLLTTDFRIEKTEVTNRLFLAYVQDGLTRNPPTLEFVGGAIRFHDQVAPVDTASTVYLVLNRSRIFFDLDTRTFKVEPGFEDHPVTGVSWYGASAYAVAYGLRLPTEAEWEVAARGNNPQSNYPFVDGVELTSAVGPHRANYAGARTGSNPFVGTTTPRGFFNGQTYQNFSTTDSPSAFGLYDQAGNVSEWVTDWVWDYQPGLDIDPQGEAFGAYKVVRGGSYIGSRASIRCTARQALAPDEGYAAVGFRTAYIGTAGK